MIVPDGVIDHPTDENRMMNRNNATIVREEKTAPTPATEHLTGTFVLKREIRHDMDFRSIKNASLSNNSALHTYKILFLTNQLCWQCHYH